MTRDEFMVMWTGDGTVLTEEERAEKDGDTWVLYAVKDGRGSTLDYGRHYALIVVVDKQGQVVASNIKNIQNGDYSPWRPQLEHLAQFNRPKGAGVE